MRPLTVGIALSRDRITTAGWSCPLAARPPGGPDWDDLRAALVELGEHLGLPGPRAAIALLWPLADARVLELPVLGREEYARILARDAARYFPTGRAPQVAAGEPIARRRSPMPVLAAAAQTDLIEAIVRAVAAAGWELSSIVPAEAAWLAGPARGGRRGERAALVIAVDGMVEVLRVDGMGPVGGSVRRFPAALDAVADVVAELSRAGEAVQLLEEPLVAAAVGAARARGPELVPERIVAARRRRTRRVTVRLCVAALALIVAAAGFDAWGASRQLAVVAARRAAIRSAVAGALARQDTLEALAARHAALERVDAEAVRWSEVLADFAGYLPGNAYLVAFRGRADSVGLEGIAQHAAGVFAALQRAPRVAGLRADAPIRQEATRPGAPPVERFAVAARLAGEVAARARDGERKP